MQFYKIETILNKAPEKLKQKVLHDKVSVDRAYKEVKNQILAKKQDEINKKLQSGYSIAEDRALFLCGDFTKEATQQQIESNSVNLIFTDPLYYEPDLHLFKDLGRLADRVLKSGGSLVVYLVPQKKEPMLHNYILENGNGNLTYWNRFIIKLQGPYWSDFNQGVLHQTKTLAWYVKGEKPINPLFNNNKNIFDFIESETPNKKTSRLTQSPIEAEYIIRNLTAPNDLVLDPMCGEGTTATVSMKLKRRFIGIDRNPDAIETAKGNIMRLMGNDNDLHST